jgi:hypothetical protein
VGADWEHFPVGEALDRGEPAGAVWEQDCDLFPIGEALNSGDPAGAAAQTLDAGALQRLGVACADLEAARRTRSYGTRCRTPARRPDDAGVSGRPVVRFGYLFGLFHQFSDDLGEGQRLTRPNQVRQSGSTSRGLADQVDVDAVIRFRQSDRLEHRTLPRGVKPPHGMY